ncbi:MAG: hypothetical protein ILA03_04575 [Bacteroidaceae bacterium]|nr:hypothetical protein [Bacteroidaceae bacterium]MBQ6746432.1 hypothetical protein [Bacteroidaceae bacterium]
MKKYLIYTLLICWSFSTAWGQNSIQENDWQTIYLQGMKYKDASNNKKALQLLEKAYELHPSDSIMRDIASVYYDRGVYRKSINISQSLLNKDSLEADLVLIAKSHEKLNNADSALVYEKIIAKKNIENANNIINLAKNYEDRDMSDSALVVLDDFCLYDDENMAVNGLKAYLLYQTGEYEESLEEYRKLRNAGDNSTTTNYYMGLAYARVDSLQESYDCLKIAARKDRYKNQYILAQYGIVASKLNGNEQEGVNIISQAIEKILPDETLMWSLYNTRANANIRIFKFEDAIDDYKRSLTYKPDRLTDIYHIAYLYTIIHDRANADRHFKMFINNAQKSANPDRYKRWIEAAEGYLKRSKEEHFFQGDDENLKDF